MVEHHIPDDVVHMPARIGIVADIGHPVGDQAIPANLKNFISYRRRYPGKNTVDNDVVKLPQRIVYVQNI